VAESAPYISIWSDCLGRVTKQYGLCPMKQHTRRFVLCNIIPADKALGALCYATKCGVIDRAGTLDRYAKSSPADC
jgi:hypothetical protein